MSSRRIEDCVPNLVSKYDEFQKSMQKANIDFIVTCTTRTNAEQDFLYGSGRTRPGPILTNARGGQSPHNVGAAFDIVIMECGKCIWSPKDVRWKLAGKIGESVGLEWAGNWKKFKEFPHFQLPYWRKYV